MGEPWAARAMDAAVGSAYLRARGVRCAGLVRARRIPRITGAKQISLGDRVVLGGPLWPVQLAAREQGRIDVGDRVLLNQGVVIASDVGVTIGERCSIGDLSAIYDTSFHAVVPGEAVRRAPVEIGRGVWLARLVTVLPGSVIGDGAVVAAGSVVRGTIPAWTVAAGNPAVPVRSIEPRPFFRD